MGRTIFADNYYSSISLSEYLLKKETLYCGILRANRKRTPKQAQAKLKTCDVISRQSSDGVKIYNWKDKRNELMISTVPEHGPDKVVTGKEISRWTRYPETPMCD